MGPHYPLQLTIELSPRSVQGLFLCRPKQLPMEAFSNALAIADPEVVQQKLEHAKQLEINKLKQQKDKQLVKHLLK